MNSLIDFTEFDDDLKFLRELPSPWASKEEEWYSGPYTLDSTDAVRNWLVNFVEEYSQKYDNIPPIPSASQSEEMSIDLAWVSESFMLLVNFPEDETEPCTFYGFGIMDKNTEYRGTLSKSDLFKILSFIINNYLS